MISVMENWAIGLPFGSKINQWQRKVESLYNFVQKPLTQGKDILNWGDDSIRAEQSLVDGVLLRKLKYYPWSFLSPQDVRENGKYIYSSVYTHVY